MIFGKSSKSITLLDLRQIYYFSQLAEHGSFSAAAAALNMTQPSLSASLAKLEGALELLLVKRSVRGIELTEAGKTVLFRAKRLLAQHQALLDVAQSLRTPDHQDVTIGLSPSLSSVLAVPLAETFHLEAPRLKLHVTEGMSHAMEKQVLHGHLDLACAFAPPDPKTFASYPLFTEELFVVTAPDNWTEEIDENGCAIRPISLKELSDLPLALPDNSYGGRVLIENILAQHNMSAKIVMNIDGLQSLMQIALRASAYTILPLSPIAAQVRQGRLAVVRIANNALARTCYLIAKRDTQHSERITTSLEIVFKITSELIERGLLHGKMHELEKLS